MKTKVTTWLRIMAVACCFSLLMACGQKGDLYMTGLTAITAFIG